MEDDKRPTEAMDAPPSHMDEGPLVEDHGLATGTEVGGYVIDGELGRGGMGVVYRATHPIIGKRAAIKVLKPSLSNNPATVERFIQEARAVNQIGHPNIIDIFALDRLPDGRSYLVMDLLDGEPLRKRVKRGPLHVREATAVIDEIASALIAAHAKGFVHRDLKPDNVFLVAHPGRVDVRLLDFGLAKLLTNTGVRAFRTATGAQLGTPDYMSPEQLRGSGDVDHRTDIYALGVMAFEILTGGRPRRYADGTFELAGRTPSQCVREVPFVPAELAQLVEAMMAAAPDERPSLTAIRTVIKRVRPTLPPMSDVALEVQRPAPADDADVPSLTASRVGARPMLPTPRHGTPSLPPAPSLPPTSLPPAPSLPPTSLPPAPGLPLGTYTAPHPSGGGLRTTGSHPSTTLGVPPPPAPPSVLPARLAAQPPPASRRWLVVGALLVIAAGIAFAIVIAS